MIALQSGERGAATPAHTLFAPLRHHLALCAIFSGLVPGEVYVDDPVTPRRAVAWFHRRLYLGGEPPDAQGAAALTELLSRDYMFSRHVDGGGFTVFYPQDWKAPLPALFPGRSPITARRHTYLRDVPAAPAPPQVPLNFALRPVTAALLADPAVENLSFLTEEMVSERPSLEAFLQQSFGVCVLHQGRVVAWCLSEYNCAGRCELGIATEEAYRRQGLAALAGRAAIALAAEHGIHQIGWHCWADNEPSVAAARKLEFNLLAAEDVLFIPPAQAAVL